MTNQPKLPTAEEALDTTDIYPPEVIGVLLGRLEDKGKLYTAAKIIRRQIELSTTRKESATPRYNELHSQVAYGRRQLAEAKARFKQLDDKQEAMEKEQQTLKGVIEEETRRLSALTARLRQIEPS